MASDSQSSPRQDERKAIRPVHIDLTYEEAETLVTISINHLGNDAFHLAASARTQIAQALDRHDAFVGRIRRNMVDRKDILEALGDD